MDYKEAINTLKIYHDVVIGDDDSLIDIAMQIAIECIEKQIPKKPVMALHYCDNGSYHYSSCPVCGEQLIMLHNCMNCCQAIDWSDE